VSRAQPFPALDLRWIDSDSSTHPSVVSEIRVNVLQAVLEDTITHCLP